MNNLINFEYINQNDKSLTELFLSNTNKKKYILGINKLTKSIKKHIEVDGVIDDFTRVHTSKKKHILQIDDIDKSNSIILSVATGSPIEVKKYLDENGFTHFNYLGFYKYSALDLVSPPFIDDFEEDFRNNYDQYEKTYNLLEDDKSRDIFTKVINFKISYDYTFMEEFTNDHTGQYFAKDIVPDIKNITFLDGGGYIGDTLPSIIKNYPDFKKIYMVEPSTLHMDIAKKNFKDVKNIDFIHCGLSNKKVAVKEDEDEEKITCNHNFHAINFDTIDNIVKEKIDFIKMDIEGDEQDAIEGATQTIKKYQPVLAICIYHKACDWYKIPQKVLEINKNYKIYIRHYMEGIYETVMYFIPK